MTKWTKTTILEAVTKCSTKKEFNKSYGGAVNAAKRLGIYEEVCSSLSGTVRWTDQAISEEALLYNNQKAFRAGSRGAYEAAVRRDLISSVCAHMTALRQTHTVESVTELAKEYSTRSEFSTLASGAYNFALTNGILEQICTHMTYGHTIKWTEEAVQSEASKYVTRNSFKQGCVSAYQAALKYYNIDKICSHMKTPQQPWTVDELTKLALYYETKGEFKKAEYGAYQAACNRDIIDVVGSHMILNAKRFQPMKPAILYYFEIVLEGVSIWKIGVSNKTVTDRYYKRDRDRMLNIKTWAFDLGITALQHEQTIMKLFSEHCYSGPTPFTDGTSTTECFTADIIDLYTDQINLKE